MSINNWPEAERPREKLVTHGSAHLSDAELLAIFLRTGVKGRSAIDVARDLLQHYDNLRQLLDAPLENLAQHRGIGLSKYALLQAGLELGRRYLACNLGAKDVIQDSADCIAYLRHRLRHQQNEVFACLYLDSKHQVIGFEELFEGSIDNSQVYPRTIVKKILEKNAAAVIFSHNHPSGDPQPSESDIRLTQRLEQLLAEIDVRVLDHIIIGEKAICSLKQVGVL